MPADHPTAAHITSSGVHSSHHHHPGPGGSSAPPVPSAIITQFDIKESLRAYKELVKVTAQYRKLLAKMSEVNSKFAEALYQLSLTRSAHPIAGMDGGAIWLLVGDAGWSV